MANLILNGGGVGATDWINPTGGLAQGWDSYDIPQTTYSIVTGNGFTTNAQRLKKSNRYNGGIEYPINLTGQLDVEFYISFKYRSGNSMRLIFNFMSLAGQSKVALPANTGNAIFYSATFVSNYADFYALMFRVETAASDADVWLEIDEVYLKTTLLPPPPIGTELIIGDGNVEVLNVNPKITISINDSRNPEKTKSTKSQLLQLPIEDNAEILGFVSDYAVEAEQVYDAYLKNDLIEIKGKLQILGVDNKSFGVIKAQFLSNNFNWINQTKTTKVNSLSIPTIEHTLTKAVVDAAVDGTLDYLYPLVDYGQFQVLAGVYVVDVIDRYPAVKVKTILTAIFNDAGYSIEGTYIDGSEFEALFMLFGKNVNVNTEKDVDSFLMLAGFTANKVYTQTLAAGAATPVATFIFPAAVNCITAAFDNDSTDGNYDNGSNYDAVTNFQYTVPAGSTVAMSANIGLTLFILFYGDAGTANVTVEIIGSLSGSLVSTGAIAHTFGNTNKVEYFIDMPSTYFGTSETLEIKVTIQGIFQNTSVNVKTLQATFYKNTSFIKVDADRRRGVNWDYTSAEMLPDITRIDFIKGVAQMLNLYFLTNENTKTVIIEKSTDFHGATGQDFSSYASREYQMKANKIYEYLYAMKDDTNDANLVDYKNVSDEYKSYRFEPENQNEIAVKTIRNGVFAATILRDPYRIITGGKFPYPVMWKDIKLTDEYEPEYDFDLRILKYISNNSEPSITWGGGSGGNMPYLTMDFLDYQKDYLLTNLELNEQFDLTVKMYLPIIVINNILTLVENKDLRAPIYLDYVKFAGWYDIESISNYNLQTGECTLKLIKARKNATL